MIKVMSEYNSYLKGTTREAKIQATIKTKKVHIQEMKSINKNTNLIITHLTGRGLKRQRAQK